MTSSARDRRSRRRLWPVLGLVAAALVAAWLALHFLVGGRIPGGTTVAGVDIGGRSPRPAVVALESGLATRSRASIPVQVRDAHARVRPAAAGLGLDARATVESATTGQWNPVELVGALFGGREVDPVVSVRAESLAAEVRRLADRVDVPPREGAVAFAADEVVVTTPRDGRVLRRAVAARRLAASYLQEQDVVRLPTRVARTTVTAQEVRRAVREVAEPAVSGPVTLSVADEQVLVSAVTIGRSLSMAPDDSGRLQLAVDGITLHDAIADDLGPLDTPPRDATFRIRHGRPKVVPARQGNGVDPVALADAVLPVLTRTGADRVATVRLSAVEPALTTAAAESLGVDELVAEYTTYYPSDFAPRLTNIHRAADLMNRTLVMPGKVFSLNRTVGERTAERGFAAGFIINGGRLEVDFGGGVSQLATTTFNAAFFAGLEILEHHPHSFYISRYPEGRESTVAWGVKDVRVRNDSGHGIFITTSYTDSSVSVRIWGTKHYRIEATKSARYDVRPYRTVYDPRPAGTTPGSCVASSGVPGFKVDVYRLFFQQGVQQARERFHTVYAPENQVVCGRSGPAPADDGQTAGAR